MAKVKTGYSQPVKPLLLNCTVNPIKLIMSPRSFWILLLKLVGLWILFSSVSVIPVFISSFFPVYLSTRLFENWEIVLLSLISILIYLWVIRLLVFKPHVVIDKLKLDKHFEEEQFSFNIHRSTVVSIAVIIIGGLMIIDTVPGFFRVLFLYYKWQTESQTGTPVSPVSTFVDLGKILIGYLLVVNNRWVVNFIEKTRRAPAGVEEKPDDTEPTASEEKS
jgi:hypothetical protein